MDLVQRFIRTNRQNWNKVNKEQYDNSIVFIEDDELIYSNKVYYGKGETSLIGTFYNGINSVIDTNYDFIYHIISQEDIGVNASYNLSFNKSYSVLNNTFNLTFNDERLKQNKEIIFILTNNSDNVILLNEPIFINETEYTIVDRTIGHIIADHTSATIYITIDYDNKMIHLYTDNELREINYNSDFSYEFEI